MSDNNKQDLVPGGQSEADEEGGLDPGSLGGAVVPVEWLAAVAEVAAFLAFQMIVKAFEEKGHEEEVAWPATMENKNIEPEDEEDNEEEGGEHEDYSEEEEEEEEECAAAAGAYFPESRLLGAETKYKLGFYFRDFLVPEPLSFLAKEATACNYEISDEESEESGVEEDEEEVDENEDLEEGPKKDLDSAESRFF
ncbi:tumor rejection antigen P815A-like [Sciurus carolinensis]|uniref:tumor rejection antigen P815A-like n=1 Tax=Sciurus carolinensis TaxID=30640 RepID=UPI001FB2DDF2|nr:tumor rejection antigen P815A-like [Sciurus carolinensis]